MFKTKLPKTTPFRSWLWDRWYEHADEIRAKYKTEPPYNPRDYFKHYKWWLKKKFKNTKR